MKSSSASKIALASYDDIFETDASREDATHEKVVEVPLAELYPFENHPFKVRDDEAKCGEYLILAAHSSISITQRLSMQ